MVDAPPRHADGGHRAAGFRSTRPDGVGVEADGWWQAGIKPDTRTDYTSDPATTKRLREKLRQEELRQRPQEGRN